MAILRAILLTAFVLATAAGQLATGARILCIESDGCVSIEDAFLGCCASPTSPGAALSHPTAAASIDHDSCDSCTDILIAPASAPSVLTTSHAHHTMAASSLPVAVIPSVSAIRATAPSCASLTAASSVRHSAVRRC